MGRDLNGLQIAQAPLCIRRELANRFDLVAQELDPIRRLGIGRIDINDAPAAAEFPGNFHRFHALKVSLDQPGRQRFEPDVLPDA